MIQPIGFSQKTKHNHSVYSKDKAKQEHSAPRVLRPQCIHHSCRPIRSSQDCGHSGRNKPEVSNNRIYRQLFCHSGTRISMELHPERCRHCRILPQARPDVYHQLLVQHILPGKPRRRCLQSIWTFQGRRFKATRSGYSLY